VEIELIIEIVETPGMTALLRWDIIMEKMEQQTVLPLMDVMICVEMFLIGQVAGILVAQRTGFCVAGRGTTTAATTIFVPGIAASSARLTRASMLGSVVPGLSRSLFFVFVLCGNLFPQKIFGGIWEIYL